MSASNGYYWSQPLSTSPPTEKDLELNDLLHECLKANRFFESAEESQKRERVLGLLNQQVKEWVKRITLKKTNNESLAAEAGGKIFTLGSYRLGVHQQGADIDTLVLGPKFVTREDFFTDLYDTLCKRPEISKITKVPDAFTPIMKLICSDIEIDLLFATLNEASVPDNIDLSEPSILKNLDAKGVRSLNGPRVADELLKLVPDTKAYRQALCAIKLWAQRRAIYSNILGFLGGIAWALLTARICQFYPKACAFTIVSRFFRIYKDWKWPQPVTLKPIEDLGIGELRVWDPRKNFQDRNHLMPIITPAYPSMNSTHNVTKSTFQTMKDEINRGYEIVTDIEAGKKTWDDLFEKSDFFSRFKYYMEVIVTAESEDTFSKWKGFAESRLRILVQNLEGIPYVSSAIPYPDNFDRQEEVPGETEDAPPKKLYHCSFLLGITVEMPSQGPKPVVNLSPAIQAYSNSLTTWESRTKDMMDEIKHLKRTDLPVYVTGGEVKPAEKKRKRGGEGGEKKKKTKKEADQTLDSPIGRNSPLPESHRPAVESPSREALISPSLDFNSPGAEEITKRPQSPVPSALVPLASVSSSPSLLEPEPPKAISQPSLVELDSTPNEPSNIPEVKKADIKLKLAPNVQ